MNPGFSERTFEFCFNAEFCQIFSGLLASHPHIPSQRLEKDLGYDVEFELATGGFSASVFIQHKTAHFAETRAGRNGAFFGHQGGRYFRFTVDNDQHNTLRELSLTKGNAFYCAPRFHLRHELETHFRATTIASHSILLDPADVGEITDGHRHNITYRPDGSNPCLHSEPKPFRKSYKLPPPKKPDEQREPNQQGKPDQQGGPVQRRKFDDGGLDLKRQKIDKAYFESLSEELEERTVDSKFKNEVTPAVQRLKPVEKAQYLLGHVYEVSWILIP